MKLVTTWTGSLRFWTQRINAFAITAIPVWLLLPEESQRAMLDSVGLQSPAALVWVLFIAGLVARNIKQAPPAEEEPTP